MNRPLRSIPDIAEQLMREFGSVVPIDTITATILRLSNNGAVSLPVLADLSRREIVHIARGLAPPEHVDTTG